MAAQNLPRDLYSAAKQWFEDLTQTKKKKRTHQQIKKTNGEKSNLFQK